MKPTRILGPAVKAEVTADLHSLHYTRIDEHHGTAYVFVTGLRDLESWFLALGGHITRQQAPADPTVTVWTLTTDTDHGRGAPVHVYALALDSDQPDPDLADAVRPHTTQTWNTTGSAA